MKAAHKSFHANITAFHAFLAGTKDRNQIDRKLKDIIALAEKTELKLNNWLDLVKHTLRSELVVELLSSNKDSIQAVQTAAFNRVLALDKDDTLSMSASMRSKSSAHVTTLDKVVKFRFVVLFKRKFVNCQSETCSVRRENENLPIRLKNNKGS